VSVRSRVHPAFFIPKGLLFGGKIMDFLEKDLEEIFFECLSNENGRSQLQERGFYCGGLIGTPKRQLYIGNYGRADIVFAAKDIYYSKEGKLDILNKSINIIEFKKGEIKIESLIQCSRYAKGIERWLEMYKPDYDSWTFNIIIVGKTINKSDWIYLYNFFDYDRVFIYTYEYKIDGIYFTEQDLSDYILVNEML
jgi:hypothetical protein